MLFYEKIHKVVGDLTETPVEMEGWVLRSVRHHLRSEFSFSYLGKIMTLALLSSQV